MRPFFIPEDFNCIEEVFLAFNIPEGDIEGTLRNFLRNYGKLCDGFKKFALNLQKYRKEKGLKKEELSISLGYDNSYISKPEKCRINIPIDRLEQLAKMMNISLSGLFK